MSADGRLADICVALAERRASPVFGCACRNMAPRLAGSSQSAKNQEQVCLEVLTTARTAEKVVHVCACRGQYTGISAHSRVLGLDLTPEMMCIVPRPRESVSAGQPTIHRHERVYTWFASGLCGYVHTGSYVADVPLLVREMKLESDEASLLRAYPQTDSALQGPAPLRGASINPTVGVHSHDI